MSKKIDLDNLSEADLLYLHDRGQLPSNVTVVRVGESGQQGELRFSVAGETPEPTPEPFADPEPSEVEVEEVSDGSDDATSSIEVEVEEDYDSWTVAELKEELEQLGLPVSGNKATLIARLEGYDG